MPVRTPRVGLITPGVGITFSGNLQAQLAAAFDLLLDAAAAELVKDVEAIADKAIADAPVKSGKFKASIEPYRAVGADEVRVGVRVGVPYAQFVRFSSRASRPGKQAPPADLRGKSAWQELLRKPIIDRGKKLVEAALKRGEEKANGSSNP